MLRVRFQSTGFPPSCPTLRASPSGLLASLVRSCSSLSLDCLSAMRPADPARLVGIVAREFLLAASACLRALRLFRGAREFIPADCPCLRPRTFFEGRVCGPRVRTFSILFRFAPFLDGLARFRASGARRAPRVDQGALPPFGIRRISTVLRLRLCRLNCIGEPRSRGSTVMVTRATPPLTVMVTRARPILTVGGFPRKILTVGGF